MSPEYHAYDDCRQQIVALMPFTDSSIGRPRSSVFSTILLLLLHAAKSRSGIPRVGDDRFMYHSHIGLSAVLVASSIDNANYAVYKPGFPS